MKKIINNRVYDTDKAKPIATVNDDKIMNADGQCLQQVLFQKKIGEFFLYSNFADKTLIDLGFKEKKNMIYPLTYEQAKKWAEKVLPRKKWSELFGEVDNDSTVVKICISLSASDADKLRRAAAAANMTISAYIVEKCLKG